MLKSFRSSKSNIFFWAVIGLLIISLAGFGIGSSGGGGAATEVAAVGDHGITVNEYARSLDEEQRRFVAGFGRGPEASELENISLRTMAQLLAIASLDGEAERLGLSVTDDRVRQALMATPAFSDATGNFDETAYEFALRNADLTAAEYDEIIRTDTARTVFEVGVADGLAYPDTAAHTLISYIGQRRGLAWVRLSETNLPQPVAEPAQSDLAAFHEENSDVYTLPERRDITYAYLTEDLILDDAIPPEDELRAEYDERLTSYQSPERRIVDRIVFGTALEAQEALSRIESGDAGFDDIATERGLSAGDIDLGAVSREDVSTAAAELCVLRLAGGGCRTGGDRVGASALSGQCGS